MSWTGRVDGEEEDVLRIHQVVKIMDLEELLKEDIDRKKVCFVSFNSDEGVRRNSGRLGARDGWKQVKKALSNFPIFDKEPYFYDLRDTIDVEGSDLEAAHDKIIEIVKKLKERNYLVIVLGGGHDIAFPTHMGILEYALEKEEKPNIGIISFDAHFDMRDYSNGRNSGTMFLQLGDIYKERDLKYNYNVFGIQKFSNTKRLFDTAQKFGVKYYFSDEIRNLSPDILYSIIQKNEYIHLTICTDVFHITSAPGVSAPQTFGVNPRNALPLLKLVAKYARNLTIDVAEINPLYDYDDRTSRMMANIIYEMILCHFS